MAYMFTPERGSFGNNVGSTKAVGTVNATKSFEGLQALLFRLPVHQSLDIGRSPSRKRR